MNYLFDGPSSAYTHNGDKVLLESLCFKTDGFERDWTTLGTFVHPNGTEITAEVCALPAQFFRFTVTSEHDVFTLSTGSGGFGTYWPIALAYAARGRRASLLPSVSEQLERNMVVVEHAVR